MMTTARSHAAQIVLISLLGAVPASAGWDDETRPTVAVVDFKATPGGWTLPPPQLGATAAALMLDQLVRSGDFQVVDGQWLEYGGNGLTEPERLHALRTNAESAGVDYLVLGTITRFSSENRHRSFGGARVRVPLIGGYRRQKNELSVSLLARVVEVRTGQVVATTSGEGSSGRNNLGAAAFGLSRVTGGLGSFSSTTSNARDAQLEEALEESVVSAAQGLVNAASRLTRARTLK